MCPPSSYAIGCSNKHSIDLVEYGVGCKFLERRGGSSQKGGSEVPVSFSPNGIMEGLKQLVPALQRISSASSADDNGGKVNLTLKITKSWPCIFWIVW